MKPQDKVHTILAEVSLLLKMYEMPQYAGGIVTKDYMIKDYVKHTIGQIQDYSNLTLDQALEYKYNLEKCERLMQEFPLALQELVDSTDFELYWARLTPIGRNFILYFHEDSYVILRQVKSYEELVSIDFNEVIKDINISWNIRTIEILGLPEEFNEYPQNKLQLLKQKIALQSLGYSTDGLDDAYTYDSKKYTEFLLRPLFKQIFEKKSFSNKLLMLKELDVSFPWYIKQQINFIKNGEKKILLKAK